MQSASFYTHWYLHLPSLVLAAFIVLLLVRLVLTPVLGADNFLATITRPVVATVGAITPRIVPPAAVLVLAMVWLAALRVGVFWIALAKGVRL